MPRSCRVDRMPAERVKRTGLVYLSYPNNPTAAVAPRDCLRRTVNSYWKHEIVIACDNPYVETSYCGYRVPRIMEVNGAS
jgi:LL-diaminopimelate aminotransferase